MLEKIIQCAWPEWKVEEKIGQGGFGSVFRVDKNGEISMPSAVKVISVPRDESEIDSLEAEGYSEEQTNTYFKEYLIGLENEIKIMAKLKSSNNIVKIEDYKIVEKEDGFGWYVLVRMELLTPLTTLIKQGTLEEKEVIKLGIDICSALELCRKEGIIHRDIKPANIFVDQNGEYKLGDFGIARELGSRSAKSFAGAEQYIAPEVVEGKYDYRADIYSLGVVLYSLLNNNFLPFFNDSIKVSPEKREQAIRRRLEGNEIFPKPKNASEEMTDLLVWACLYDRNGKWRSEEKDVPYTEKRIESASRFKKELEDVLSGNYVLRGNRTMWIPRKGIGTEPIPGPEKPNKKIKVLVVLIALLLFIGCVVAFSTIIMKRGDKNETVSNGESIETSTTTPNRSTPTLEAKPTGVSALTLTPNPPITVTEEPTETVKPTMLVTTPEPSACEHVYVSKVTKKATCGEIGVKKYTCSECGDSYTETISATGKHSYKNECDESCDVCGKLRKVSHIYASKVTKKATCSETGVKKYTCSECGDSYTETISATGKHSYKNRCDESCDVCGKLRNVSHTYVSKVTKQATCSETGRKTFTCSECGDSYTETISATGKHSYKNGCDESCDVCGKLRNVSHIYVSKVTKQATCSETGRKTYTCSECGDSYTETISATGKHSYKNGCDESCDVCGKLRNISHIYVSKVTKQATCSETGRKTYTCSECGDSYTEVISATGKHSYALSTIGEATCGKSGEKTYTCSGCGDSYTEVIAATGRHSYDYACDESCNVCGKTREVEHKFSSNADLTCDVCNEVCGYWSEYGAWSEWQDTAVSPSDSRQVDTPRDVVIGYNKKTQWKYSRYYGYYKAGGYYLALDYSSGICTTYEETVWLDEPLPWNKVWSNAQNRYNEGYGYGYTAEGKTGGKKIFWYNEDSQLVDDLNSPIYKTQYRYRERYVIYY